MRYAVAALALAGVAMAGEGYPDYKYPEEYPTTYPTDYPQDYKTQTKDPYPGDYPSSVKSDDPIKPYPTTYDPAYPTYPVYPTSTKKDDAYPTTTCTDEDKYGKDYPVTSKYDHEYEHGYYTTSTIYTTKVHVVTKGHDVETKTEEYPYTTTVYPVKTKYPEKEYPEKEGHDTYKPKPTYPASKYPEKETKKYEAACPTYSVKTIHTSVTTVVPTVIYETVSIPCSTYKPIPTGSSPNGTYPKYPPVTAGAASFAASSLVAAVAGLAAFALL